MEIRALEFVAFLDFISQFRYPSLSKLDDLTHVTKTVMCCKHANSVLKLSCPVGDLLNIV